ncbi:pilus assembly protein TadG [Pandoraea terrae]|uniref:Pilus assembly protein TadG n=1 Tax=Pandoraea terrae TaxID=1537710 RepID=A0A5E4VHJ5_9BURK|nr:TadE family protein [Pandoraea terrae]VVE11747.1 pilus assembly protein TadG [Pandoraea terrae]
MNHRLYRIRRMRGAVAVEFALVAIPMVILLMGIAEVGHAFYQYNTIVKSVRDAARMLSAYSPAQSDYPMASARCLVVYGNSACSGPQLVPGLTTNMVVICDEINTTGCTGQFKNVTTTPGGNTINLVQVTVTGYPYSQLTAFFPQFSQLTFDDISSVMRQAL